tara:strand:+ start:130 stop:387 length:258 start_codon:yes stop_codon:yes gene_type:complete
MIYENLKIMILGAFSCSISMKKTFFVQSGRKWPESHHMAGNGYLGYRGPILHRDSISKHVLKGFRENRKKSIFEILICGSPHYEY